jgi:hypothetical protein
MKTQQEKEQAIQELKEQALDAIVNIRSEKEQNRIRDEYIKLVAKYAVGDKVWAVVEDGCPQEFTVCRVIKNSNDGCERIPEEEAGVISYIIEHGPEKRPNIRMVSEKALFPTRAALIENMKALIELLED